MGSVVRSHVNSVGGDGDGSCEAHLLPAGGCFAGKSGAGQ